MSLSLSLNPILSIGNLNGSFIKLMCYNGFIEIFTRDTVALHDVVGPLIKQ